MWNSNASTRNSKGDKQSSLSIKHLGSKWRARVCAHVILTSGFCETGVCCNPVAIIPNISFFQHFFFLELLIHAKLHSELWIQSHLWLPIACEIKSILLSPPWSGSKPDFPNSSSPFSYPHLRIYLQLLIHTLYLTNSGEAEAVPSEGEVLLAGLWTSKSFAP